MNKDQINIEVKSSEENALFIEVNQLQNEFQIKLPSDYIGIVQNYNGLKPINCYYITLNGEVPLIEFSEIIPLKYLSSRLNFYREFEELNGVNVLDYYIPIGDTVSQGKIFLGANDENLNKVFYFDPSESSDFESDIQFIAEDIIAFFNNNLMPEDKADAWILNNMD